MPEDRLDLHNERVARAMQRDGRVFLAPAMVDRRTCLRACFVNYSTTPDAAELVLGAAAELGDALSRGTDPRPGKPNRAAPMPATTRNPKRCGVHLFMMVVGTVNALEIALGSAPFSG
jgi:hypothetical protein